MNYFKLYFNYGFIKLIQNLYKTLCSDLLLVVIFMAQISKKSTRRYGQQLGKVLEEVLPSLAEFLGYRFAEITNRDTIYYSKTFKAGAQLFLGLYEAYKDYEQIKVRHQP